jgi:hypothetical protein
LVASWYGLPVLPILGCVGSVTFQDAAHFSKRDFLFASNGKRLDGVRRKPLRTWNAVVRSAFACISNEEKS